MSANFATALLTWFDDFGRKNLPWQKNISPYSVWVSEIMLQQTQVATVIPYFNNFMKSFPTIKVLANANLDDVLHLWTGLGYYARARNIHKTANIISNTYQEVFPNDLDTLMSLPGIGRSTAGAILSIAFQKPTPILDGNVKRVLARYHALAGDLSDKNMLQTLWKFATDSTPHLRCADYTQAIMDLGATICTRKKPACNICPMNDSCLAHRQNQADAFPTPKQKKKLPIKTTQFLILQNQAGDILLEKRPPTGIWGGLWSFPEYQRDNAADYCQQHFDCTILTEATGEMFRHTFSHFHLDITPVFMKISPRGTMVMDNNYLWCNPLALPPIGLAAPIKKLLENLLRLNTSPAKREKMSQSDR